MNRIAATLLLLLLAIPAWAGRVMVIRYPHNGTAGGTYTEATSYRYLIGGLQQGGAIVDQRKLSEVKTEWIRTRTFPVGANWDNTTRTGTITYDYVVLWGWRVGQGVTNIFFGTTNPDSLTLAGRWPTGPIVFISSTGLPTTSMFQSTAACSTGVTLGYSGAYPSGLTAGLLTAFVPGTDIMFKTNGAAIPVALNYANNNTAHGGGAGRTGYLRPLVGMASNAFIDQANCTNCDWPIASTNWTLPDSAIAWERGRSSLEPDPLIFVQGALSGGQPFPRLWQLACARADSAAGGTSMGQMSGWEPATMAVVLYGMGFHTDNVTFGTGWSNAGLLCSSAKCESTSFKARLDSLGTLASKRNAVLSLGFQTDSARTYPNEVQWVKSLPKGTYKVFPQNWAGVYITLGSKAGNASTTSSGDTYGYVRKNRELWSIFQSPPPYVPAFNDTSVYAQLYRQFADTRSLFGAEATCMTQYPPESDYFPLGYSRNLLPHPDSVGTMFGALGVRTAILNIETRAASPGNTLTQNGSFAIQPEIANPIWWTPTDGYRLNTWLQGMPITGRTVKTVAQRGPEFENVGALNTYFHEHAAEFSCGNMAMPWYFLDPSAYYHNFHTKLSALTIPVAQLTNTTGTQGGGYYFAKWAINAAAAVNRYAYRPWIRVVAADDL